MAIGSRGKANSFIENKNIVLQEVVFTASLVPPWHSGDFVRRDRHVRGHRRESGPSSICCEAPFTRACTDNLCEPFGGRSVPRREGKTSGTFSGDIYLTPAANACSRTGEPLP